MKHHGAWICCLLSACASSVTQDPPQDPGTILDASTDAPSDAPAPADAGVLVIGQPCKTDSECGGDVHCQLGAPEGYCSFLCTADADCPSGSLCSPVPFSRVSGICMKSCTTAKECRAGYACAIVHLFPGQTSGPSSSSPVCWEAQDAGP